MSVANVTMFEFQTPESIKAALAAKYFLELKDEFSQNTSNINSKTISNLLSNTNYDFYWK